MATSRNFIISIGFVAGLVGQPLVAQQRTFEQLDRRAQGAGPAEVGPEDVETLIASAPVAGPSIPTTPANSEPGTFALPVSAGAYGPYSNIFPLTGGQPLNAVAPLGVPMLPSFAMLAVLPFGAIAGPAPVAIAVPAVVPTGGYVPPTTTPEGVGLAPFPAPPPPNAYGPRGPAQTASGT